MSTTDVSEVSETRQTAEEKSAGSGDDSAADADDYVLFESGAPDGNFDQVYGIADDGTTGLVAAMPSEVRFYRMATRNASCGMNR